MNTALDHHGNTPNLDLKDGGPMIEHPAKMNKANMISATNRSKSNFDSLLKLAGEMEGDLRADERLYNNECRSCFYGGRVSCPRSTMRRCMCCGEAQYYSSTATDVLCLDCATKHKLCKRCGGDLEMRTKRRNWPVDSLEKDY